MIIPNMHYADLKESYLFYNIAQKTKAYVEAHPGTHLYRMGIGDVSLPLCDAVIQALHERLPYIMEKGASAFLRMKYLYPAAPATNWEIFWTCLTGTAPPS